MTLAILLLVALLLACANGTNDNFKGVATLFTTLYQQPRDCDRVPVSIRRSER
jgi:phosphate/sulfate permease